MVRLIALTAVAAAIAALAAACGGGGGGGGRVAVRRLDLEDVALTMKDYFDPAIPSPYPAVVAEVNGVPITGESLVRAQVRLELGRRQTTEYQSMDVFPEEHITEEFTKLKSTDPLEELIDDELERQAVERLGYLPSYEEAVANTREQEAAFFYVPPGAQLQRDDRITMLDLLGWPHENWADDPDVVETHRQGMGIGELRRERCKRESATEDYLSLTVRWDCSEFLRRERQRADIVYYVKWAD